MELKYKCVVADHDDTAVDSTRIIHYPIYVELIDEMRPSYEMLTLDGFIEMNRNTGIKRHYVEDLEFTEKEWNYAFDFWLNHPLRKKIPDFYSGFLDMMQRFKEQGGIYTVVSHSDENSIRNHYNNSLDGVDILDMVIGATGNPEFNKPNVWPLEQIMNKFSLYSEDIVVVDDLEPGIEMAEKMNVDTVGVGWSHQNSDKFKKRCKHYVEEVDDLEKILF